MEFPREINKSHIKNPDEVIYDLEQLTYADSVEGRGGTAICCDKAEKIGRKPKLIQTRKIGYEDVISFLSSYGCKIKATSFDEISKMSYVEGADFLVDQILPNIEKFVKQ